MTKETTDLFSFKTQPGLSPEELDLINLHRLYADQVEELNLGIESIAKEAEPNIKLIEQLETRKAEVNVLMNEIEAKINAEIEENKTRHRTDGASNIKPLELATKQKKETPRLEDGHFANKQLDIFQNFYANTDEQRNEASLQSFSPR